VSAYQSLAGVYDALTQDVDYPRRADYLEKLFRQSKIPVHTVLDLACGTGEMSAILAERGYEIIAVDGSPDMLAQARTKFDALSGVPPILINQNMPALDLYGTVDAAICCLDSLNYLTSPKDVQKTFQRLHLFVAPGGLLVFDVNSPAKLQALDGQVFLDETDDVFCVWRTEFDKRSQICSYWIDLFTRQPDHSWTRCGEEHRQKAYSVDLLKAWLLEAGFIRVRTFGDCRMSAPKVDEQRIFFSAVRA